MKKLFVDAIEKGDYKEVESLISKEANINAKNKDGKTPYDLAKNKEIRQLLKK